MKKLFKTMVTCLAALAIVLGSVTVSASAMIGPQVGPQVGPQGGPAGKKEDKSIVFQYVARPDQSVAAQNEDSVKFTVVIADGQTETLWTGDAFKDITENKEKKADEIFKDLLGKDYEYKMCYFNWAGDFLGDKVEVKQFRNMEKKSNLGYESLIGFRTKDDKKDSTDYNGKGEEAKYYAYNPTGTLMVVFAKKAAPEGPAEKKQNVELNYYVRLVNADSFVDETTEHEYKGYDSSYYSASLDNTTVSIPEGPKAQESVFANESNGKTAKDGVEAKVAELTGNAALSLSDEAIREALTSVTFEANMIYSIDWYVCKLDSNDGIHVDGKLVATPKSVVENPEVTPASEGGIGITEDSTEEKPGTEQGGEEVIPGENEGGSQEEPNVPAEEKKEENAYVPVVLPPQTEEEVAEEIIDVNDEVETPEGAAEVEEVETVEEEVDTDENEEPVAETLDVVETETPEALPQTGTSAPVAFYILGSLLMAAGAVLVFKKRI